MENEMGQELLDRTGYIRTPRKYFVATNSNGDKLIRGSADNDYSYCVILTEPSDFGGLWGSWSATEHNAKKRCKTWNNKEYLRERKYEVVKCVQVTAKEVKAIKKEIAIAYQLRREQLQKEEDVSAGKNPQQETENNHDTN
jgi:hypothetical protein